MRSRPKIELHLSPDPIYPGARITATLTLESKRRGPALERPRRAAAERDPRPEASGSSRLGAHADGRPRPRGGVARTPEVAVGGRLEGVVSLSNLCAGSRSTSSASRRPSSRAPKGHELRVTAVASRGKSVTLSLPVKLHPEGSSAPEGARPAAVGEVRVEKIWARALAKLGRPDLNLVSIDPRTGAVVLAAAGRSVSFSVDVRGAEGPFLTASCTWPSLGLGLSLRSRGWSDFVGTSVHDDVDGRLVVRAREELQVKALLDAPCRDKLLSYTDVRLEDAAGHIASQGTAQRSGPLAEFIGLALDFDAWMSTCFERVQPPLAIDASLSSYRALAAKRHGTLHPGDMSIDLTFAGEIPACVRHRFEGVAPVETVVEVPRPPRLLRSEEALLELARATGARVALTRRKPIALQLWLPLVADASALEPVLTGVEATLEKLSKKKLAGPYR